METSDTRERLSRMEGILERLEYRLLGNGQPGEIDKLDARIVDLEETAEQAKGAFWTLSAIITFLSGTIGLHLFKKG